MKPLLLILCLAISAVAQQSHAVATFGVSGSTGLGYTKPDIPIGVEAALRRDRFALTGELQRFFNIEKTAGAGSATRAAADVRYYVRRSIFAGGGLETTRQSIDGLARVAVRPRVIGGIEYKDTVVMFGYSFADQTNYRTRSFDVRFEWFKARGKWLMRLSPELRLARFDTVDGSRTGVRFGLSFGFGRAFRE